MSRGFVSERDRGLAGVAQDDPRHPEYRPASFYRPPCEGCGFGEDDHPVVGNDLFCQSYRRT